RVIDDHVQDDAQGMWLPVPSEAVRGLHEVDQVLLRAEVRVDAQVVVDVVAVIGAGVVLEDGGEPDGGAAEPRDVVEVAGDALDGAAVEVIGGGHARRAARARRAVSRLIVMEAIHHQEVDELFAPLPLRLEVDAPGRRREVEIGNRAWRAHGITSSARYATRAWVRA